MKFRAPGRVNLIGEHTDYNDGFVLPVAIEMQTIATATPAPAMQFTSTSNPPAGWEAYVLGVEKQLRRRAVPIPNLAIEFSSTLPLGAGLSSSAAFEVSAALAFIAAAGFELPAMEVAKLCQQAEIETVGLGCGIMDQFISLHGRADHAILLDCRSLAWRPVPIPEGITLVIADTGVKHALASSEYNTRRKECEEAAAALGVKSLRDAIQDGGYKRARHIVSENARVLAFVEALAANDRKGLGELMAASHESLRVDYEVSCPELDAMVAAAQQCPGLIGARMTGGGFGGSTINLVETGEASAFAAKLAQLYPGATIHITRAASGAGRQNP
ncbi:MAG: galactokinase [Acidobacteria bacterium]|nr:galactokinase [Acidobacteriota bacterium]